MNMDLRNMPVVFTIGHSTHSQDYLISLLQQHRIQAVCDVRSHPYSKANPQFNRGELRPALERHHIRYVFMGNELGARSDDPSCYERGRVRYDRLAKSDGFQHGMDRIAKGAANFRMALMCSESDPASCHRMVLIGRRLTERGMRVEHILADGSKETQEQALLRLADLLGLDENEGHMFRTHEQFLEDAYEKQERRIAYEPEEVPDREAPREAYG